MTSRSTRMPEKADMPLEDPTIEPSRPISLTIVVPSTEDSSYVEQLIDSLHRQLSTLEGVEVLIVTVPQAVEVRYGPPVGMPSARVVFARSPRIVDIWRAGIEEARGDWITFPRGDSLYGRFSIAALLPFLEDVSADVAVVALNTKRLVHSTGELRDTHLGRWRFRDHARVVDLTLNPEYVQSQLESSVVRVAALRGREDTLVAPLNSSDDPLLIADVLAQSPRPMLGLAVDSEYFERIRSAADVELGEFRKHAANYLRRAARAMQLIEAGHTPVPRWIAFAVIGELATILRMEMMTALRASALSDSDRTALLSDLRKILQRLGSESVEAFSLRPISAEVRAVLAGWAGAQFCCRDARISRFDPHTGERLVRFYFTDAAPEEIYRASDGRAIEVIAQKTRILDYFGQSIVKERIAWVGGDPVTIQCANESHSLTSSTTAASRPWSAVRPSVRRAFTRARHGWLSRAAAIGALARVPGTYRRFDNAWALMDRADLAGDNAEHFYRWIRSKRPESNVWFILRRDSADYARLRAEGFRLVPYGSIAHQVLLNKAVEYLSSHAGVDVLRPMGDRLVAKRSHWRFTFLQHGVIHNDLSIWLNGQRIDRFVTSTTGEFEAIGGDSTSYVFTEKEVRLTGMPRHDALRRLADARPWADRRVVLIAPTWRNSLFHPATRPGERRVPRADFAESEYVRTLIDLLSDERLHATAEQLGLEIVFLPHPNVGGHFPVEKFPSTVRVTSYAEENVQELLSTCRFFVTDYSSVAFDAAFANAAVVYFQADGGAVFGTDHTIHPGYFQFERDGFGPVCRTVHDVVDVIHRGVMDPQSLTDYRARSRAAFVHWDDLSCERVVQWLDSTSVRAESR